MAFPLERRSGSDALWDVSWSGTGGGRRNWRRAPASPPARTNWPSSCAGRRVGEAAQQLPRPRARPAHRSHGL